MGFEAQESAEVASAAPAVAQRIAEVLSAEKATVTAASPDGLSVDFTTRKTLLSWELEGRIVVTPLAQGSHIGLVLNTHHNRPAAALDGVKNAKSAKKLIDKITAGL